MDNTQEIESPEVFNKDLLEAIAGAEDGHLKKASAAASKMVRRRIRENGFSRLVLPYKQISDSDLNQLPDTELPVIIEEMEPESPGAKSIAFNDSADTEFYRGDKFVVFFSKIRILGGIILDQVLRGDCAGIGLTAGCVPASLIEAIKSDSRARVRLPGYGDALQGLLTMVNVCGHGNTK